MAAYHPFREGTKLIHRVRIHGMDPETCKSSNAGSQVCSLARHLSRGGWVFIDKEAAAEVILSEAHACIIVNQSASSKSLFRPQADLKP